MTQHSDDSMRDGAQVDAAASSGARILPFERPQSDLQRAIQVRAQEAIERERAREREVRRPQPLKKLVVLAISIIPVFLIFGAANGFLRAMRKFHESYQSEPAPPAQQAPIEVAPSSQPGVVILQPLEVQRRGAQAPGVSDEVPEAAQ